MESKGIIMFNRGEKCIVRAIVCLYSLRKHYDGKVTFYLETPYPKEFDEVCSYFNVDIVHNVENHELKTLVRKTDMFGNPPYDRTLWIDSDTIVVGKLDEMFGYLDTCDVAIPHFAGWISTGHHISKRVNKFRGIIEDKYLEESLKLHPAVNTGVLSFKKSDKWKKFVEDWVKIADQGSKKNIFISDEVSFQILYPNIENWGLKCIITPTDFNVSVLHDGGKSKDPRIIHFHGQKSVLPVPLCEIWKKEFKEMCDSNIANINSFLKYADKRLKRYMNGEVVHAGFVSNVVQTVDANRQDTTIVTACDEYYVDILRETFPNWRKYKNIDAYPVMIFVHGIPLDDSRLEFLNLPNVTLIPWEMKNAENHREEMLSAFVFGTAENVKTDYWLKLDADSYATNNIPFITEEMKLFSFCGHKWGYSRPDHIKKLDDWAKGHWKKKLRKAKPMIESGKIEGNRFHHRRTISFIQLHKTQFTKFCVSLLKERKLPAPTQDTYMFYVANRFNPESVGIMNFKKRFGFTQGKGKMGADYIRGKVLEVEANKVLDVDEKDSDDIDIEKKVKVKSTITPAVSKIDVSFEPVKEVISQFENLTKKTAIDIPDYAKIVTNKTKETKVVTEVKVSIEPIKINENRIVSSFFGRKFIDETIVDIVEI